MCVTIDNLQVVPATVDRKLEGENVPMDVIFPLMREGLSTAMSEKHTVESLNRLEKV